MVHIKNKSTSRNHMDFGKKMEHQVYVIADFMKNSCTYAIIKHKKWNIQRGVGMGLILEMICTCNGDTFKIMCHSIMRDMIILILVFFMVLEHVLRFSMHVYESQRSPVLPQQDGVDVNLNVICLENEIDHCHLEVQQLVLMEF